MSEEKNGKIIEKIGKRKRVATYNSEPTKTQQQFKDQVNVNKIMEKYKKIGTITHLRNAAQGVYMDLTNIQDLQSSLSQIQRANSAFNEIPAEIRLKFNNDPSQLISWLKDEKNHDEAVKHGLIIQKPKRDDEKPKNDDAQTQTKT